MSPKTFTRFVGFFTCWIVFLSGCASAYQRRVPQSLGEQASGFGYVPLDGLGVIQSYDRYTCFSDPTDLSKHGVWRPILDALPDVSVRFAVASVSGGGGLTFGPTKVTAEGQTYRAILDYVNVDAVSVPFFAKKTLRSGQATTTRSVGILTAAAPGEEIVGYEAYVHYQDHDNVTSADYLRRGFDLITVPVYVGIGMRLSADIRALKGNVALSSLGAIAAEAQANRLTGTLTVQTLGVTGPSVATSLPLPSKLDQTTVENGILALGSSRALIYGQDQDKVRKTPRIVGLYSPVYPDPRLINIFYSQLASNVPSWFRPCGDPVR